MPNRLAFERSPYLRQHMENPVDWYPWGDEAFAKARSEHKPILLSIGYAACHWCHVMAHESFEDAGTAALMNAAFVNVKVDREERPDVDALYMRAVQALTRHGGWPMTVFLTPDGAPFFGGTYFPPDDRHGLPAFRRVLAGIAEAWRTRRDEVTRSADSLRRIYDESPTPPPPDAIDASVLVDAARQAVTQYDAQHGGFGGAPKFPPTMTLDFLLRRWARTGDEALLEVVRHTWDRMARGGVFDQVGGGFHRYTVDGEWLVPHFEKMLYDNALLVRLGAHLWQATGDAEVRATTETTLDWLAREMTSPDGGFYASLDADSEGHEGRFYVWTMSELEQALGDEAPLLSAYWGASAGGNFEGRNILWRPTTNETFALRHGLATSELARRVTAGRERLFASRTSRIRPARDEKIIAGWNGLMLRGVAEVARIFDDSRWRRLAVRAAEFLAAEMVQEGRALRVHGSDAGTLPGVLEDHAALGLGFLAVHSLTFDARWLTIARQLATACERHFWDDDLGAFLDTADDAPPLIARLHDPFDNALPSGASLAVELQLHLAALDGDGLGAARARRALAAQADLMRRAPLGFGHLLGVADAEVDGAVSVVLAGTPGADDFTALARAIAALYVPSLVLTGGASAGAGIAEGKHPRDGHATAYVCRGFSCDAPTTSADELARQLGDAVRR